MGDGGGPLQPAGLLPEEAVGLAEVGLERTAEMGHPGQAGALKDAPHAVCPPIPIPYAGVSMKPLCSVGQRGPLEHGFARSLGWKGDTSDTG